jgi:hypothetical protein
MAAAATPDGFSALARLVGLEGLEEVGGLLFDAGLDVNGGDELREILDRTGWRHGKVKFTIEDAVGVPEAAPVDLGDVSEVTDRSRGLV